MVRVFCIGCTLVCLGLTNLGLAQTTKAPSLSERVKSVFRRNKPSDESHPMLKKTVKQPAVSPRHSPSAQVTTRSGSLRQPGGDRPAMSREVPNPTFVQEPAGANRLPTPGGLARTSAKSATSQKTTAARPVFRDAAVQSAGFESAPPKKKSLGSWWSGLWKREKTSSRASAPGSAAPARLEADSNSIDPRRVYRGPKTTEDGQDNASRSRRGTNFSETGVPQSTSEFRGRGDSRF